MGFQRFVSTFGKLIFGGPFGLTGDLLCQKNSPLGTQLGKLMKTYNAKNFTKVQK